jgi:hypothetical protein
MMALQALQVALQASKMALQPEKWFYSHRQRLYSIQKWFYSPKYGSTAEKIAPRPKKWLRSAHRFDLPSPGDLGPTVMAWGKRLLIR